ncbi:hypothetical protein F5Y08DRAFT_334479 [Xylaria arbuscula]|nr:hypothetical protein F5Y08DRAFT_334479 [Xylaria arbuscula]
MSTTPISVPKPPYIPKSLAARKALPNPAARTPNGLSSASYESKIVWKGRIKEAGELMSFTGPSLQDIEAQVRAINTTFSWSRDVDEPGGTSRVEGDTLCDIPWDPPFASVFHIRQGISYLRKIHGDCVNGPGPGNCSRVSCSYRSGIWFCNDNPQPMSVPCSTFGDRAWDIIEKCYAYGDFPDDSVYGQVFDTAGWNVIVAGADC